MLWNDPITAGICDRRNGGQGVSLHRINTEPLMSALGQKETFPSVRAMSGLPPKKQTSVAATGMSALCQKRTFGSLASTSLQASRHERADRYIL
jgi:hypothetical protein